MTKSKARFISKFGNELFKYTFANKQKLAFYYKIGFFELINSLLTHDIL